MKHWVYCFALVVLTVLASGCTSLRATLGGAFQDAAVGAMKELIQAAPQIRDALAPPTGDTGTLVAVLASSGALLGHRIWSQRRGGYTKNGKPG